MKLAYILGQYPNSTETFIAREIEELRRQGFVVRVWALQAGDGATTISRSLTGKLARRFGGDSQEYWGKVGRDLAAELRAQEIEHVHAGWANELALVAWAAADAIGVPWSFSAHARDLWVEAGDLEAKLRAASFASACTRAGAERLREAGPADKVAYAPHGLELPSYSWREWEPGEKIELLGVGRLVEKKGWNLLMQVLPLLATGADVQLTLIGEGPLRRGLEKQAKQLKIAERVTFAGTLPHEAVMAAMRRADCLVLPSLVAADGDRDGLANVLLEGAALGVPLVTTDAGSAADFVSRETGQLVAAGDPAALLRGIAAVLAQPDETKARCRAARRLVEEEFEVAKNVGRLAARFRGE